MTVNGLVVDHIYTQLAGERSSYITTGDVRVTSYVRSAHEGAVNQVIFRNYYIYELFAIWF